MSCPLLFARRLNSHRTHLLGRLVTEEGSGWGRENGQAGPLSICLAVNGMAAGKKGRLCRVPYDKIDPCG